MPVSAGRGDLRLAGGLRVFVACPGHWQWQWHSPPRWQAASGAPAGPALDGRGAAGPCPRRDARGILTGVGHRLSLPESAAVTVGLPVRLVCTLPSLSPHKPEPDLAATQWQDSRPESLRPGSYRRLPRPRPWPQPQPKAPCPLAAHPGKHAKSDLRGGLAAWGADGATGSECLHPAASAHAVRRIGQFDGPNRRHWQQAAASSLEPL
jgi:hypothetical protein